MVKRWIPRSWLITTIAIEMIAIVVINMMWTNCPSWIVLVVFFSGLIIAKVAYACKKSLQKSNVGS